METQINRTEGQDSFEFGKASARMNIRFMTIAELDAKVKTLKNLGFIDSEGNPCVTERKDE